MPHRQVIRDIQAGLFKPVYLLHGEEPYFIDEIAKALETNVVEESMRDFNHTVVYGRDTSVDQVLEAARRFPMMAERQLVLMREAQNWPAWRRKDEASLRRFVDGIEAELDGLAAGGAVFASTMDRRNAEFDT